MFDKYETEARVKKLCQALINTVEFSEANSNEDLLVILSFKDKWLTCFQYKDESAPLEKSIDVRIDWGDDPDPWDE